MWSNADEVEAFIADHKGGRWSVGDRLVLPDIEQPYRVIAVRPFNHRGKFKLFVDLEAPCAVEHCGEYLVATKEVHQWMTSPHLTRCCAEHRYGFSTPMSDAWKTAAQLEVALEARQARVTRSVPTHRTGPNEDAVLQAMAAMSLVGDRVGVDALISCAVDFLPLVKNNKRDTRRQRVARAIISLRKEGRITVRDGVAVL